MATSTATKSAARARTGPAAAATTTTEPNARRFRWLTMPPIEGFALEHDAGNQYRCTDADGKRRTFTGSQMPRVIEELRSPGSGAGKTAAAGRKSGSRSSGSASRNAGK